ncbi:MAG TPA: type III pantothenate kinase [Dehalococcoidia bacterium]|nr:type III pantothenate kinase [Dehalococcoidia bacterium]
MLLAVDIGNTTITLGVFKKDILLSKWRVETDTAKMADEYAALLLDLLQYQEIPRAEIKEAVMCCVVPDMEHRLADVCRRYLKVKPLIVEAGVRTGLRILYDSPREVGADRVVDAVAAVHLYGPPLIIVDLGTATVFDAINRDGDYLGGAIAPGLGIAAEALFQRAAKLYRVEMTRPHSAIGRNTETALQSGLIFGYIGLIEGLVARFKEELGEDSRVIATGGYADLIAQGTAVVDHVNPDLTLLGLRLVYEMNRG